ncbi:MAG TPA: PAS domain S-box protein [Vicinamibacterales bacterium]|nr:PAS domain S-box protein [Vicinamibacterales bacterium]
MLPTGDRSSQVLPTSSMGVFDHDVRTNAVYCSPEVHAIYGWPAGLVATLERFDQHTHPDDRAQRTDAVARAHDYEGDGRYSLAYRIIRSDGEIRWVNARAQTFFEGSGPARSPVRVIGAITDVTDTRAAAALLQDREDRLRRAETLARMGHFTLGSDGAEAVWSDGNKVLFGFGAESTPSFDDFFARLHPDDVPRLRAAFARAAEDGTGFEIEFRVLRPAGGEATIHALIECTRHPLTSRVRFFGTNLDVTAQRGAEAALLMNEERLRQAVRLGRLGIFDHDHVAATVFWSPEQREIWGLGPGGDVPFESTFLTVHPDERDRVHQAMVRSHDPRGDGSYELEHRIVAADGSVKWIHARAQTYFEGAGADRRPIRTVGATADVTERKKVEIDLRVKDNALASWVSGMLIVGLDRKIAYANPAWLRMHGFADEAEILGKRPFDFIVDPVQHARIRDSLYSIGSWMGEVVSRRSDGSTFDAELSVNSVTAADGTHVAFLGSIQDITERRRAEAQVRRSEAILRSVFEASKDAIVVTKDQRALFANRATAEMYGFDSAADVEGQPLASLVPTAELPRVLAINKAREEGRPAPSSYETKGLRRDGTEFDAEISASTYTINDLVYPLVVIRDVSARKAAERALRESAERLSKVFNSTSDAQILHRVEDDGRLFVVSANEAYRMVRAVSFPGAPTNLEGRYRDELLVEQGMSPEQIEMEMPAFRQVIATRQPVSHEIEIPLPGGDVAFVESHLEPVLDSDGRCTHVLWVGRNITERRRSEEAIRQLNVELERRVVDRTAQLEAANHELEAFAYSVSHDLRAPARAVDSYAGILAEDYGTRLDAEGLRLCGVVRSEAQRMGRLIDDLLMFSRLGRMSMQTVAVDMTSLAAEVFDELSSAQDRTRITFRVGTLPTAEGDRALLRQVWVNLLANALKFSAKKPVAVIGVSGRVNGDEVVYTVSDNGAGFDMAYKSKLFGVFQRLHTDYEFSGTGVGLAIVQRIVHRHGGRVWAEAEIDRGAVFSFALPAPGMVQ